MQLRTARLCIDCEEVHDELRCPVCASETFTYLVRWIPTDDRRRGSAPTKEPAQPPAAMLGDVEIYRRLTTTEAAQPKGMQLLKKGVVGLAAVGVVGWLWGRKDAAPTIARRKTGD
jgi:hypothetical protein